MAEPYHPTPEEVRELRTQVQDKKNFGITAAQNHCAKAIHITSRAWQQYESGSRKMHPAFFELAKIKLKR